MPLLKHLNPLTINTIAMTEQENFSPEESLQLIQTMIAKTRKDLGNKLWFSDTLWGLAILISFIKPAYLPGSKNRIAIK